MMKTKKKGVLADKIADILHTTPNQIDPEDDIYDETAACSNYVSSKDSDDEQKDNKVSQYRKRTVDLLEDVDNRYTGKKCSRKHLRESSEGSETENDSLSTDGGEALDGIPGTQEFANYESEDESMDEETGEHSDSSDDDQSSLDRFGEEPVVEEFSFKHLSNNSSTSQIKKGNAVQNQLNIWENLLEIRIQFQKCLLTANKFPQTETYESLNMDSSFKSAVNKTKKEVSNMLDKFLLLQSLLLKQYNETSNLLKHQREPNKMEDSDEEILSNTDEEIASDSEEETTPKKLKHVKDWEFEISQRNEKYKKYRNVVIQKWNDKTRLAVGKNSADSNTVLQQIEYILGDRQKLLKRTQLKRSEFEVLGKQIDTSLEESRDECDPEIFDDTDFYHQLLRELVEVKSGDVNDPIQMSKQWISLQSLRSKMKRKIDVKATKGRKIRYVVHSKLVNFLAPINVSTWTEDAKNELYNSLFGNNQIN